MLIQTRSTQILIRFINFQNHDILFRVRNLLKTCASLKILKHSSITRKSFWQSSRVLKNKTRRCNFENCDVAILRIMNRENRIWSRKMNENFENDWKKIEMIWKKFEKRVEKSTKMKKNLENNQKKFKNNQSKKSRVK